MLRRLLLLGAPGVGKGTQAARLVARLGVPQISTGDMLRAAVAAGTAVGREARGYMDRGDLVPDAVVIAVAEERLRQPDTERGFILDGFPRTAEQARALDAILARLGRRLDRCVVLSVGEQTLVDRLRKRAELEGRSDDNEATIRNRMRVYREQTQPLIDHYRNLGVVAFVAGDGSVDEVAARIAGAIAS